MRIKEQKELSENGVTYIRTEYDNGTIATHIKPTPIEQEPTEEATPEPTNTELQELLLTIMEGMVDLYEATDTEVAE